MAFGLLLAYLGVLFVAIVPPAYLVLEHKTSLVWLIRGAIAWGIGGIIIKGIVWRLLEKRLKRFSSPAVAIVSGLWSGIAELGVAAVILWHYRPQCLLEVVAFGVGAGSLEALDICFLRFLICGRETRSELLKELKKESKEAETRPFGALLPLWGVLERANATVFHTATRALVYLSLIRVDPLPGLIALVGFTILDGSAHYGDDQKADWLDHRVLGLFEVFGLTVTAAVVLAWWALW